MSEPTMDPDAPKPAPIPRSFVEYVRAMGPGIVVVLTWLGAGDIVDASVAGGAYGYALMWVLALALAIRWMFVSAIARYQLCNQHGESVMDGLKRLHPVFPPFILLATILLSHVVGIYMYQGLGESFRAMVGWGDAPAWALAWGVLFAVLVFRSSFRRIEIVFLIFLGMLSVSLIGAALWVGPDVGGLIAGTIGFRLPEERGAFKPMLVATSLIGAVAGSLANLMYPYFIREKGWTTPAHRKVQFYDLALGVAVIVVLDLAVWVLGAEVLHPRNLRIETIEDMAGILGGVLGPAGRLLFYLGVFAAVGSSVVGNALAYSYIATDAYLKWRAPEQRDPAGYRTHPGYRWMVLWCLFSPLPWVFGKAAGFVALTVAVNAFQVLLLPILAGAMWALTAGKRFIGVEYRNRWWENLLMGAFLAAALLGAYGTGHSLIDAFSRLAR